MLFAFCNEPASAFAEALDALDRWLGITAECALCSRPCCAIPNEACGHTACGACWLKWGASRLQRCKGEGRMRIDCCHAGCSEHVGSPFWSALDAWVSCTGTLPPGEHEELLEAAARLVAFSTEVDREYARLGAIGAWRPQALAEAGPVCAVCREHVVALLHDPASGGCAEHAACEGCWLRWAQERLEDCMRVKGPAVPCLGDSCRECISTGFWRHLAGLSDDLARAERLFGIRRRLVANDMYPPPMQVDCPLPECIGLGYLGFDTVMCFVCEHVWVPQDGAGSAPVTDVQEVMGVAVKRCPSCAEYIEKNGGCDHMTCRCKCQFYWSTLRPYPGSAPLPRGP